MKNSVLICVIYLLLLPIDSKGQVFVRGHINNLKYDSISFLYEENYIALNKKCMNTKVIKNTFSLTLPIKVAGKVSLEYQLDSTRKQTVDFYAQPKDSVILSFDADNALNAMSFEGRNFLYNRYWYFCEQNLQKNYTINIKKRTATQYLKYMDSLAFKEIKNFDDFIETTTKKDKSSKPTDEAMFHSWCSKIYKTEILKMKYPEQKYLLDGTKTPLAYYDFLKSFGFQHDKAIVSEDYRNFLEIYLLFLYQQKYGTAIVATIDNYQQLYELIPTAFKGSLTKNFLQARVIAKIARDFPAQVQEFYTKYLQQNPTNTFNKDVESIVQATKPQK